jgi:predicted AAA+ superfamily ATPase
MNKELYYQYNPWWEEIDYQVKELYPRPELLNTLTQLLNDKNVVFLTGLRRVGKTTLIKQLVHYLLHEKNIKANHIFYISLDDYLLRNESIIDIIDYFRQLHRLPYDEHIYLFLDEITYKTDFRQQLKNLYDKENCKIYVSSSSSSALRDQRGYLTGRERIVEVMPLSFDEFLTFKKISLKNRDSAAKKSYFEEYMQIGGMPEYVLTNDRNYLTTLIDDILYKDIVAFHGIKNPETIKDFFILLMERAGKQISLNKMANILSISPDTAKRYLEMFLETYLIYAVPRFGKTNERLLSPKKVYAADVGIRNLATGFRDKGAIFENLIFLALKQYDISYLYEHATELDFIVNNKILIEVKYGQELNSNQQKLFDNFSAEHKFIVNNWHDIKDIKAILNAHP